MHFPRSRCFLLPLKKETRLANLLTLIQKCGLRAYEACQVTKVQSGLSRCLTQNSGFSLRNQFRFLESSPCP
jgi:hypothetical protein